MKNCLRFIFILLFSLLVLHILYHFYSGYAIAIISPPVKQTDEAEMFSVQALPSWMRAWRVVVIWQVSARLVTGIRSALKKQRFFTLVYSGSFGGSKYCRKAFLSGEGVF